MSYKYQLIALVMLLFSAAASGYEVFADVLYWHATEAIDWVYANNENSPNQTITYKTIQFSFEPNYRIGVKVEKKYDAAFIYTRFYTHNSDKINGNLVSGFIGDRIVNFPNGYSFQAGQVDIIIDYSMFDFDLSRPYCIANRLRLAPVIGIRGGWINQTIQANFQGSIAAVENVKNDFLGVGPKVGIHTQLSFYQRQLVNLSVFADFMVSYLWGSWKIEDVYTDNSPATAHIIVPNRNLGALTNQAAIGVRFQQRNLSVALGYEITDWFDQCQFFDNGTGGHSNNLVLQGCYLRFAYTFIPRANEEGNFSVSSRAIYQI